MARISKGIWRSGHGRQYNPVCCLCLCHGIAAGGSQKISVDVTVPTLTDKLTVSLVDDQKKIVASSRAGLKPIPQEGILFGILSDNASALDYMKAMTFYDAFYGEEMQAGDRFMDIAGMGLAVTPTLLNNLTTLVINDYDTGKLTIEQWQWIQQWVRRGGNLILGTGAGFDQVMAGIDQDFLPVRKTGTGEETVLVDAAGVYEASSLDQAVAMTYVAVDGYAAEVVYGDGNPVSFVYMSGSGRVILHCFDLGLAPVSMDLTIRHILNDIYSNYLTSYAGTPGDMADGKYDYLLTNIPQEDSGTITGVFVILLVYAFILGPVLYIILKKMDKRERGWLMIPAAVCATLVIFWATRGSLYSRPLVNVIQEVRLENGSGAANSSLSGAVLTADQGDVSIGFTETVPVTFSSGDNRNHTRPYAFGTPVSPSGEERLMVRVEQGNETKLTYYDCMSW